MKKSRDWFSTLAIIGGILLVLYPTISNFLNLRNATRVIEQYSEVVDELTDEEAAQLMDAAAPTMPSSPGLSGIPAADGGWDAIDASTAAQLRDEYMGLLDLTGTGVMGYITIPRLDETMPIYHTTEEKVLQVAHGAHRDLVAARGRRVHPCGHLRTSRAAVRKTLHQSRQDAAW